jgi:hypothetical protein
MAVVFTKRDIGMNSAFFGSLPRRCWNLFNFFAHGLLLRKTFSNFETRRRKILRITSLNFFGFGIGEKMFRQAGPLIPNPKSFVKEQLTNPPSLAFGSRLTATQPNVRFGRIVGSRLFF